MRIIFSALFILLLSITHAQTRDSVQISNDQLDSIYIDEVEDGKGPDKVLHAEPLFIDLIRDLGARKGEKEWNIGMGMTDNNKYSDYTALIEYEWAPVDRLGLEVELPFSFYYANRIDSNRDSIPLSNLNSVKLAAQYSFFVSEKLKTSAAIGYIHEFEAVPFNRYGTDKFFKGNVYNPFLIVAKRWGQNFHTLIYAGPQIFRHFHSPHVETTWQINTNLHYMIDGTRNFIGVELNKEYHGNDFDMTIRPQMRVGLADNLLVGIVAGIPFARERQRFSTFIRLIYEPGHKH
jgi:hypothetical protein